MEEGLPALGLDTTVIPTLEKFAHMLLQRNQAMNLTAITEPKDVASLHLLDSLELIPLAGMESGSVVDVGTGAGFPGLPLAVMRPGLRVTLLDSLGKRVDFLRDVSAALKLQNVACVQGRAEEFAVGQREAYDWAVSRAVAALPVLCELCLPLVKVGGVFLAMKSVESDRELEEAGPALRALGGQVERVSDYAIPGTEIRHRLVVIRKASATPGAYPRPFARMKKRPL